MAEQRKVPMPPEQLSHGDPYSAVYPANRQRESTTAPEPTGVRQQIECGKNYQMDEQSAKKVD